jgi:hypothetical protein
MVSGVRVMSVDARKAVLLMVLRVGKRTESPTSSTGGAVSPARFMSAKDIIIAAGTPRRAKRGSRSSLTVKEGIVGGGTGGASPTEEREARRLFLCF